VSRRPQLVDVDIIRPWLSDQLLDRTADSHSPTARKYFGSDGSLRVIPSHLEVLMPDEIRISGENSADAHLLQKWAGDSACCRVVCNNIAIQIAPSTVRLSASGELRGRVAGLDPLLFAIVSSHRISN
jgi:hypothetical protein